MEPVPTVLAFALQEERGFGAVFCEWRPRVGDGEAGARERDEFVFAALGSEADTRGKDGYREVTAAEARHIVAHWMRHSMAYGRPLSGSGLVSEVAEPFFRVFSAARYFTNLSVTRTPTGGAFSQFTSKTKHTFDTGVVATDAVQIGMVWFADED